MVAKELTVPVIKKKVMGRTPSDSF